MNTTPLNNLFFADTRIAVLENIISGLKGAIEVLVTKNQTVPWFDGLFLAEESEPVYGLGFVAFQTYIVGTITDLKQYGAPEKLHSIKNKHIFYQDDFIRVGGKLTRIELIVALANYFKHRDEGIKDPTLRQLNEYGLLDKEFPVNEGLGLLTQKWDLDEVTVQILQWRKQLEIKYC